MENTQELRGWLNDFGLEHPLVIGGPCSAETEEQVLKIAHELKDSDATVLRAGIWKPRTRPGNFEGVGALGLKWLKKAKEETGMMIATEVANPTHVDLALEYDVDILWLGARTTVSPFIVQEIADALKGTDKIVLVKNPVNPDLPLWLGAIERLYTSDIKKLGAIHRGFSSFRQHEYRNPPEWEIVIELRRRIPELPIVCDPSHICGNKELLLSVSQIAMDLLYDGLMIESHINPDVALSDSSQQLRPESLKNLLDNIQFKNEHIKTSVNPCATHATSSTYL